MRESAGLPESDNDLAEVHALPDPEAEAAIVDPKTGLPYPEGATAMTPQEQMEAQGAQALALEQAKAQAKAAVAAPAKAAPAKPKAPAKKAPGGRK